MDQISQQKKSISEFRSWETSINGLILTKKSTLAFAQFGWSIYRKWERDIEVTVVWRVATRTEIRTSCNLENICAIVRLDFIAKGSLAKKDDIRSLIIRFVSAFPDMIKFRFAKGFLRFRLETIQ